MPTSSRQWMTPAQYLEFDRASEVCHESYDGAVFARGEARRADLVDEASALDRHERIVANVRGALQRKLTAKAEWALATVPCAAASTGRRENPDIVVVCGEPQYLDGRTDTLTNPTLVIEVLSPSTERYDRGPKAALYRKLASLREYAIISQDEAGVEISGGKAEHSGCWWNRSGSMRPAPWKGWTGAR